MAIGMPGWPEPAASTASMASVRIVSTHRRSRSSGDLDGIAGWAGSAVAFLEATVVNIALPAIGRDLGADLAGLQWTLNAYLLTLAALILLGGSLGDRYGRRRVFELGVAWFTAASLLCALAPNVEVLIAARVVQGVGGALLTPGSLAIIEAVLRPQDRGRA